METVASQPVSVFTIPPQVVSMVTVSSQLVSRETVPLHAVTMMFTADDARDCDVRRQAALLPGDELSAQGLRFRSKRTRERERGERMGAVLLKHCCFSLILNHLLKKNIKKKISRQKESKLQFNENQTRRHVGSLDSIAFAV